MCKSLRTIISEQDIVVLVRVIMVIPHKLKYVEKNFIHRHLPIYNQFSWFTLSQNTGPQSQCHSFSPFFDCLIEFSLRKTIEKCVYFIDYFVV